MGIGSLLENPFFILGASPRDSDRRILDRVSERMLLFGIDGKDLQDALLYPSERLEAEIGFLPGLPDHVREAVCSFAARREGVWPEVPSEYALACFNAAAAFLEQWPLENDADAAAAILALARLAGRVNVKNAMRDINSDRLAGKREPVCDETDFQKRLKDHLWEKGAAIGDRSESRLAPWELLNLQKRLTAAYSSRDGICYRSPFLDAMISLHLSHTFNSEAEEQNRRILAIIREYREDSEKNSPGNDSLSQYNYQNKKSRWRKAQTIRLTEAIAAWDALTRPQREVLQVKGMRDQRSVSLFRDTHSFFCDLYNIYQDREDARILLAQLVNAFPDIDEEGRRLLQEQSEKILNRNIGARI